MPCLVLMLLLGISHAGSQMLVALKEVFGAGSKEEVW